MSCLNSKKSNLSEQVKEIYNETRWQAYWELVFFGSTEISLSAKQPNLSDWVLEKSIEATWQALRVCPL